MKTRKPYAEEFKQEAVRLVIEQGMAVTQVARDLDISVDTLHRWLRTARKGSEVATEPPTPAAELVQLRREVEQLRLERDILKKALGISSRMPH
jgi:transposase